MHNEDPLAENQYVFSEKLAKVALTAFAFSISTLLKQNQEFFVKK